MRENKYRKLIEATGTGYLVLDRRGRVVDANKEYLRLSGHKNLQQILGRPVTEWTAADQKKRNADAVTQCMKEGHIMNFTVDYVNSSGRITPVEINATAEGKGKAARILSICRDISERKQAETALRESEAKYRTLYKSSQDALMTLFPPDWTFTSCNNATVKMFGAKDEAEFTSSEPWMFSPKHQPSGESSAAKARQMIETAMKNGSHFFEWTHKRIGGEEFQATVLLTKVELNGQTGLQATVRDITRRKRIELELKESKALIESVVENVPLMIFLKEAKELRFAMFNRAGEELLGYDRKGLLGKSDLDFFPTEQAAFFIKKDREVLDRKTGFVDIPEEFIDTAGKGRRILHTRKVRIKGPDGKTKYLLGISEDITERRKMEEELKISHDRLTLFSEMDSILLRCQGESVYSELAGLFTRTFRADCVSFGYIDSNGDCVHPRLSARCMKALGVTMRPARFKTCGNQPFLFAKALAAGRPVRSGAQPGHCTRMQETLSACIRFNSKPVGFISLGRKSREFSEEDLKRLDQLAQHLSPILNARLEKQKQETEKQRMVTEFINAQKIESLGVIAGGIAHDFNNMLAGIMGNLSLLDLEIPKAKKEWRGMISEAVEATEKARHLARELITFSRGGAPVRNKFNLGEVAKKAALFAARGSNCSLKFEIQKGLWQTDGAEAQISQTIHNLIINAVQAMPDGGRIELTAVNELSDAEPNAGKTRYVKLSIRDHGVGIEPENTEKIFDPFFSTKAGGRGLGLTMAHTIVKRHDGHITIQSEPGNGSCFTILLPAVSGTGGKKVPGLQSLKLPNGTGRVLLLEDDRILAKSLCRILRRLGYTPFAVGTGEKLLAAYAAAEKERRPFRAVIIDLMIPGAMGGEAAVKRLKVLYPGAKAIVSSGHLNSPAMSDYRAFGFDAILPKPYKYEVLAKALARLLAVE